jgi:hypothetical protein
MKIFAQTSRRVRTTISGTLLPWPAILAALLLLGTPTAAMADVIYGPKVFTMSAGKPQSFTGSFSSQTAGCAGSVYTLQIKNGSETDISLVSSARVVFDGVELLTERDFRRQHRTWSFTFAERATHTLQVQLKSGRPGSYLTIAADRQAPTCGPAATIDYPAAGAVVETNGILVTGTVQSLGDVGVSVNGKAADIQFSSTAPPESPLRWSTRVDAPAGPLQLRVVATDGNGGERELRRTVMYIPRPEDVRFSATVTSGVAPLSVSFGVTGSAPITKYEVDVFGNGSFGAKSIDKPFTQTYTTAGVFIVRLRAYLASGAVVAGEIPVTVQTFATMNTILRSRWNAFTTALSASDVEGALRNISPEARGKYEGALRLISPTLAEFATGLATIHPVWIRGDVAHYLLTRTEEGTIRGYHVYFSRDADGRWKVTQF